jgi:hypothetical protein
MYVAWQDDRLRAATASQSDILLSSSADGATWSAPRRVNRDRRTSTTDHALPTLAAWGGGVAVSYVTADTSVATPKRLRFRITDSSNGGATFHPSWRVGPVIDLRGAAKHTVGTPFLGDYLTIAAGPGRFVPTWTVASRPPSPTAFDQALWAARVPWSPRSACVACCTG